MEIDPLRLVIKPTLYQGKCKISWAQFMDFKVLMIVDGAYKGYMNCTKLVALAPTKNDQPKMLRHWFNNDGTKALIKIVARVCEIPTVELTHLIQGGNSDFIGNYCHPEFEYLCNKIINKFADAY
jgi:KilA-N domain